MCLNWVLAPVVGGDPVFGLGAKARKDVDIKQHEGTIIQLSLILSRRTVPAIVTREDSEARKTGKDLMFMTCGQRCVESLKTALEQEKNLFGNIEAISLN